MEPLPPIGNADLVTKQDLEVFAHELKAEIANQTRTIIFALVAVVVSISTVALFR